MTTTIDSVRLGGARPTLTGVEISGYANALLEKTYFQKQEETLNLNVVTPRDLGFTEMPLLKEILSRATEKGYGLCPPEVGPRLRELQPEAELLYIGMNPLEIPYEGLSPETPNPKVRCIYWLTRFDGKVSLNADTEGDPMGEEPWNIDAQFVFIAPK